MEDIRELAEGLESYVVECRRRLHRFPELGGQEFQTGDFVESEARKLGLQVERVGQTGRIVILDSGNPGPVVALRADMDALPVTENPRNSARVRDVISQNPGVCHACGHDAHVAMLLGAMKLLAGKKDSLRGRVLFCFESDEENGTGWPHMMAALENKGVCTAFAIHVWSALEHGLVAVDAGPRMSGMVAVKADFVGRGGHGSRPDLSINPVFAAAAALNNLAVAAANQVDANETLTLGITSIQGGSAYNVFPDRARVLGTMRYFKYEVGEQALEMLKEVFGSTAKMNRCTVEFDPLTRVYITPTVNDVDAAALADGAFRAVLPEGSVVSSEKWYASESFSEYLNRWKGAMAFLGIRNEELGCTAEHHNEYFDVDESVLVRGTMCYAAYAVAVQENPDMGKWKK